MTEPVHQIDSIISGTSHKINPDSSDFPTSTSANRPTSDYVNIERRSQYNTVFFVDDSLSSSIMPRPNHWSVAWSDLMMTMFVLFLSMYVYQMANEDFLTKKKPEIIGGDTTEALQTLDPNKTTFPFPPIHPGLPLITAGTVKKAERVSADSIDSIPSSPTPSRAKEISVPNEEKIPATDKTPVNVHPEAITLNLESAQNFSPPLPVPPVPLPDEDVVGPNPIVPRESLSSQPDKFQEIYRLSKDSLDNNNLNKFAAIDIVPDKTMRIILTGDLLFPLGGSELSENARDSLLKITTAIRNTPYMINVVGHTDNIPMRSGKFKSNWELSVARASSVTRYLIDEIHMDPSQFVISGFSSYRPVAPNTTTENRAKNRRVEIIISKRLPDPLPATAENLK
ncbi:MAG: flagellar motor protein MotB [Pseudomonadota bacterium]